MNPNDLYAREPEKEFHPFSEANPALQHPSVLLEYFIGVYYNHLAPDIDPYAITGINRSTQVVIKVLRDFHFDHRRFWRLSTVWFNNAPVMIIQNAGREGDDFKKRYITDPDKFIEMLNHIRGLFRYENTTSEDVQGDVIPVDMDNPDLVQFADHTLDGFFERY